jgi:uncharacterized protein (DUF433 family)
MTDRRRALLETPAYPFAEAAHYLHIPVPTLRAWCVGYDYEGGTKRFKPVILLDGKKREGLSFLNLVEAHVLSALRRQHRIPLPKVRRALDFVAKRLRLERPLYQATFATNGVDLFVDELDRIVNVSREGQVEMSDLIRSHLQRIERDARGIPIKLYPFTNKSAAAKIVGQEKQSPNSGKTVVIDPRIAFGRPVLVGTAVPTAILADRFKAGDTLSDMAQDYGAQTEAIEEAIRCEFDRRSAA